MKTNLISSYELEKCYSIAPIKVHGKKNILVAAEKVNKCILFDTKGKYIQDVWDGPGGTMSMVEVPGKDATFLATHKFYSPNDSKEAKIVLAKKSGDSWEVRTIKDLPFVHRFDIIKSNGVYYIIACTIKSDHEYKEDWTHPGKIYVCELPDNLDDYNEENQLKMEVIKDGLTRNHGYLKAVQGEDNYCLIGSQDGVFKVIPPDTKGGNWSVEKIIDEPTSDMALSDFDNDGEKEIITISPFHGENIRIYKKKSGKYEEVYRPDFTMPFSHSIWGGTVFGENKAIIGQREGKREIVEFYFENGEYKTNVLAKDTGSANIYLYEDDGKNYMVSTNREINQIAFYELIKE